jgi:hypothetical protein
VRGILGDADSTGQFRALLTILRNEPFVEFWEWLEIDALELADVGLPPSAPDALVWQVCQAKQVVLITSNRNALGSESLEATIRTAGTASDLPVLTISDPKRMSHDRDYALAVAERVLDYLLEIDRFRGTGRLYVP